MISAHDPIDISHPPRRRRSSLLDRWIKEQQTQPHVTLDEPLGILGFDPTQPSSGTPPNAYLAYPDLAQRQTAEEASDDDNTVNSYDLVQDDDIPAHVGVDLTPFEAPTTPKIHRSSSFLPASSFRGLLSFRSASPSRSISRASNAIPVTPSRKPIFPRHDTLHPHNQHSRAASLSTLSISGHTTSSPKLSSPGMSKWRPSVMGHFGSPSSPGKTSSITESTFTPSRPSISSCITQTSTAPTTVEMSFQKLSLVDSLQSTASPSMIFKTGGALSTLSRSRPPTAYGVGSSYQVETENSLSGRAPFAPKSKNRYRSHRVSDDARDEISGPASDMTRPHVAYTSGSYRGPMGRMVTRESKKKKLVASGVGPNESRKFEAFRRWCESFGEVNQITRMPDGDLHVHFRDAEVAETVCRLRARVFIAGVGSVYLSWYTGNKR
ncbi:hypothetical protein BDN71DRAFT_1500566 [Pleurotus eryngii]|uniref:Uncharacterized protein n=1 Tax=Pleurotus eryngii TaxID=5323 RepID=A0A9P6AA44_PLEER|nr:hypothetical protein BDN71DRAFT_1500566 [Pleurotus eryngii]